MNHIKAFVFDVDGVLTDGTVLVMTNGEQLRRMSMKDGYSLKKAIEGGFRVGIISGGKNEGVRKRLNGLGLQDIHLACSDKLDKLDDLLIEWELSLEEVLYMGDDMPDYEVMTKVGLASCPADASPDIKAICDYVSPRKGGEGCVRDVIEQTMKVQEKWIS